MKKLLDMLLKLTIEIAAGTTEIPEVLKRRIPGILLIILIMIIEIEEADLLQLQIDSLVSARPSLQII